MTRQIIRLTGEDRVPFLQGLVTNDVARAPIWAAMLTPQGKYLADFLIVPDGDALLIDVDARLADDLIRRLSMYKLRSKVVLEAVDVAEAAGFTRADRADCYPSKSIATGSSCGQSCRWRRSDCRTIQREIAFTAMASRSPRLRLAMG